MKLSQFKNHLNQLAVINFSLPNGATIPAHFHITEAGLNTKHFIDCGGTIRTEQVINLQIWVADDTNHRLMPEKLKKILAIAENHFGSKDLDIEVEYQTETLGRYGLDYASDGFKLTTKNTACLAQDQCGIEDKNANLLHDVAASETVSCTPGGKCC